MQSIRTRHFGPSNVKGSRIQAKCATKIIYIGYNHALDVSENHRAACRALLLALAWDNVAPMAGGYFSNDMYRVFQNDISTGNAA